MNMGRAYLRQKTFPMNRLQLQTLFVIASALVLILHWWRCIGWRYQSEKNNIDFGCSGPAALVCPRQQPMNDGLTDSRECSAAHCTPLCVAYFMHQNLTVNFSGLSA